MFKCIYGYCQRNPNVPRISDKSERSEKKNRESANQETCHICNWFHFNDVCRHYGDAPIIGIYQRRRRVIVVIIIITTIANKSILSFLSSSHYITAAAAEYLDRCLLLRFDEIKTKFESRK